VQAQFEAPMPSTPPKSTLNGEPPAALLHNGAGFARAGGILGVVSAGLLLGGGVAISVADDPDSEPMTRGLMLGVTGLSVPVVAILAWRTRERAAVPGFEAIRSWGWSVWSGATLVSALQWALVLGDDEFSPGLTLAGAGMGALAVSIHAVDAFASARRARLRIDYRITPMSFGATLRF